jgi:hypothetical protein
VSAPNRKALDNVVAMLIDGQRIRHGLPAVEQPENSQLRLGFQLAESGGVDGSKREERSVRGRHVSLELMADKVDGRWLGHEIHNHSDKAINIRRVVGEQSMRLR